MTLFRTLGLSVLAAGTLAACDASDPEALTPGDEIAAVQTAAVLEADGTVGSRFQPVAQGDVSFRLADGASAKSNVGLTPLYNIAPPEAAHATHLALDDDIVSASYLIPGLDFGGGFDAVDTEDPEESSAFTADYLDLAEVTYRNSDLYFSGSLDINNPGIEPYGFQSKAIFARVEDDETTVVDLSSDFVMDAAYPGSGNFFYVVTGADGDVYRIQRSSLNAQSVATVDDLRSVAYVDGDLFVLTGSGEVFRTDTSPNSGVGAPIHTVEAFGPGAIAKMHVDDDDRVYVPNGIAGFHVLDEDGDFLAAADIGSVKSLATDGDLVFVANAGGGVLVMEWVEDDLLVTVGYLGFPEGSQVNHVEVDDDTLFVAAGASGVYAIGIAGDDD